MKRLCVPVVQILLLVLAVSAILLSFEFIDVCFAQLPEAGLQSRQLLVYIIVKKIEILLFFL